jgi:HSP20 family protein
MNSNKQAGKGNGERGLAKGDESVFSTLRRDIDDACERIWRDLEDRLAFMGERLTPWPAIDAAQDDKGITLRVDVPGMDAKDVEVEVSGHQLTVRGKREEERKEEKGGWLRHERHSGSFTRSVALPPYIDAAKVEARYEKGVLTLTAPKIPGEGPKRVQVKTG